MKFTLSWLKDYLDTKASLAEIAEKLTAIGLEVENITDKSSELAAFRVAEIVAAEKHPNADKLRVCQVNAGSEILQIVCGAPNARAGLKVVLAPVGTHIPNGDFTIKAAEIRGVKSNGMLCSAAELNLGKDSAGIIELPADAKVGALAAEYLGGNDPVIEIAITPNRSDCLGVYGIARDLAAAGLGILRPEDVTTEQFQEIVDDGKFASPVTVSIAKSSGCSYFIGRTIRGVKNGPSPDWLKQRLEAIGLKSISTLVDITNYVTYAFARPSHVYDAAKLKGNIAVRSAKAGEKLTALDDKNYALAQGMCVIADESGAIGLGGIIGGKSTGVSETTKDVFLEVALFDAASIAATGRALQIDSDARYRFERGVSANSLKHFITISQMITKLCGGEASTPTIAGSLPMTMHHIKFSPERVKSLAGILPSDKEIKAIFTALGLAVKEEGKLWDVKIPSWRPDIEQDVDLVEEAARIYGYDKIPAATLPRSEIAAAPLTLAQKKISDIRRTLAGRGLRETVTFSFIASALLKKFGAANDNRLENPISADLDAMRPSIIPSLVEALSRNEARGFADLGLFEIGPIFDGIGTENQRVCAAGIRAGQAVDRNVHGGARAVDMFDAKADALAIISHYLPTDRLAITRDVPAWYHPGRAGAVVLGKQVLGYFGELHPGIIKALGLSGAVVAFEVFPASLPQPKAKKGAARGKLQLSNFQAVNRDFAFLVDEKITAAEILKTVRQAEKNLITEARIFDVYAGKNVETGKKSVAFTIRLQAMDRTLTDQEIEGVAKTVIENVQRSVGGVLRG